LWGPENQKTLGKVEINDSLHIIKKSMAEGSV